MLTTTPYLRIRRPSPTTAEFVVSTLPPPTLPLRITLAAIHFLRLVLSLGVLLLLYSVWTQSPYSTPTTTLEQISSSTPLSSSPLDVSTPSGTTATIATIDNNNDASPFLATIQQTLQTILHSRIGQLCSAPAASLPPWITVLCSFATLYLLSLRIGVEERLLVLRGLGIQTSSSGETIFSPLKTRFIPTDKIQDILINEAFRGFEVRHILVVIVEGEEHLVVVFPKLLPRPRILEKVWRGVRGCLYEQEGRKVDGKF
ncbi:GPI-GlcNAc transferase complex, PIG-H component-domain-containing protein [Annulohypoxylon maeteangense]|uniref:GPI-GlcNAc transferase complex, PIG-H component-domain-containing protein n=1 Tax=Annulohypoxylon maeteangense TaxID=1927788 RepID=UPI002007375A|nr:GPI-GlcNAc transferase complex, PIG-H component-domain-containing protein [Annulohypoxylon maeteangense]KAI0885369.1 GPI-GlcNAc transferase complex, PIG-H component-domain-containing protein [Annulohypoxylon maeteangense]